jgi:hypothetical protein
MSMIRTVTGWLMAVTLVVVCVLGLVLFSLGSLSGNCPGVSETLERPEKLPGEIYKLFNALFNPRLDTAPYQRAIDSAEQALSRLELAGQDEKQKIETQLQSANNDLLFAQVNHRLKLRFNALLFFLNGGFERIIEDDVLSRQELEAMIQGKIYVLENECEKNPQAFKMENKDIMLKSLMRGI